MGNIENLSVRINQLKSELLTLEAQRITDKSKIASQMISIKAEGMSENLEKIFKEILSGISVKYSSVHPCQGCHSLEPTVTVTKKVLDEALMAIGSLHAYIHMSLPPVLWSPDRKTPVVNMPDWLYSHEAYLELLKICHPNDTKWHECQQGIIDRLRDVETVN